MHIEKEGAGKKKPRFDMTACVDCELSKSRTQVVVGSGSLDAPVLIVGEAPGKSEDEGGKPFIGRSGVVLDEILEKLELDRSMCYITNVVRCRPPQNRNPKKEEIEACSDKLAKTISRVKPSLIITLGSVAAEALLGRPVSMSQINGKYHNWNYDGTFTTRVLTLYHPAATLYNPSLKAKIFEELAPAAFESGTGEAGVTFFSVTEEHTESTARMLARFAQAGDVYVLCGDLGAGKTHLSKAFGAAIGVEDEISSPTFNIMLSYEAKAGCLNHFDLYRLERKEELDDIDFYSQVESDCISLIEWGDKFEETLNAADVRIDIELKCNDLGLLDSVPADEYYRSISFRPLTPRGQEIIDELYSQKLRHGQILTRI